MQKNKNSRYPNWMPLVLKIAGVYNIVWGISVIFLPNLFFDLTGMPRPSYPMIWQCVGMIVGVYGVGYWVAARDPLKHWPITLVGFLGKIFGPIGFAYYLVQGAFPVLFGLTIMTNDLLWWIPFGLILKAAYDAGEMSDSGNIRSV